MDDLDKVIAQDSAYMEARLRRASLRYELGDYDGSIADYSIILSAHPDFIPAYMGIAYAQKDKGNDTEAQRYAQMAMDVEEKLKNRREESKEEEIVADNQIADQGQQSTSSRRIEMFNRFTAQNMERAEQESKYSDVTRGAVQNHYTDLVSERNFVLSFYAKDDELRRTNHYHPLIELYNKEKKLSSVLKITNNEIPLTEELVEMHFQAIDNISSQLTAETDDADVFFNRAMEFSLVQDFASAINDLNKAIMLRPDFTLAYFARANIRNKQIEYDNNNEDEQTDPDSSGKGESRYNFDAEMIMRDYDRVIALLPDFAYAWYNRANMLCVQKDYQSAIGNYSRAIELNPELGEAYFNRGLTYIYLGNEERGVADLSKAGELGIYQAYSIMKRLNNN